MSPVTMYDLAISLAVLWVLACLFEKDINFQLVRVNMSKGQDKSLDYLKIQSFGQIPAFKDEHAALFESRAICRYICDKYADKGTACLLREKGAAAASQAEVEQWLEAES